jgi:Fic family protein
MRTPKYTLTNLILNYIVKYELGINNLKHNKLPEKHTLPLIVKYGAQDTHKLGDLVGNSIGYNQALLIQRGQEMPSQKKELKLFTNFRNAKDFVKSYNDNNSLKPSMELASHINKLVMKGLVDEWDLSKVRSFSQKPNEIYDTWYKKRDFYPNLDMTSHFNDLFDWIQNGKDSNHKLIKIGILLYEFIDKGPFLCGNQITAILMVETLTKKYGYNPDNIIPFFKSIESISEDILSAFKLSKSKLDLTTFLEAFLYTISMTVREVTNDFKETYNSKVRKQGSLELHLNARQIELLDYLELNKKINRSKYTKLMGVSFMTSYRDLQDMVEKKYIKQKGRGRGTFYVLTKEMTPKDEELI